MDFMGNIGTQSCTWAFASRLASGPSVRKELKFEVLTIFEKIHLGTGYYCEFCDSNWFRRININSLLDGGSSAIVFPQLTSFPFALAKI